MKVAEIVGAKSELWTRLLPSAISDWSNANQLDEINKNTKSLLRKTAEEALRDPNFDFSISSSIWTQRDESDQNVDWAKQNLR